MWRGWSVFLLAGCIAQPQIGDSGRGSGFELASGTSLAAGCEGGELVVSYSLGAHPLFERYEVALNNGSIEVERFELAGEGTGSTAIEASVVESCLACSATLFGVDAQGTVSGALLAVEFGTDLDTDGWAAATCGGGDCDDAEVAIHPDAAEACDGVDNNCSGFVDDLANAPLADKQEGVCSGAVKACDGNGGWAEPDYAQIAAYEVGETACDGLDNDCDGVADVFATAVLADKQEGVCAGAEKACGGSGWVEPDYSVYSSDYALVEVCDDKDNDCDGTVDDLDDAPLSDLQAGVCTGTRKACDGQGSWLEPDYTSITGYEAVEATCDGADNDCDESVDNLAPDAGALATEQDGVCLGARQVCDGGDWVEPTLAALPDYEAVEVSCDSLDNDCDGTPDNFASAPLAAKQDGVCAGSEKVCAGAGWLEPNYAVISGYEVSEDSCDQLDNDCNGDEDWVWRPDPSANAVECWGDYARTRPVKVDDGPWKSVVGNQQTYGAAGWGCAIAADDTLHCWGDDGYGQLGDVDESVWERRDIRPVTGGGSWKALSGGGESVCGLQSDGTLWCWGYWWKAPPDTLGGQVPTQVGTAAWAALSISGDHGCALGLDDSLWCWGQNDRSQLGVVAATYQADPVAVGTESWRDVAAAFESTCGIRDDRSLWCWGLNNHGQMGIDPALTEVAISLPNPVAHPAGGQWDSITAGQNHYCAIDTAGAAWCWGRNLSGELGAGDAVSSHTPRRAGSQTFASIEGARDGTCGIDDLGGLWCWGADQNGELGDGNWEHRLSPGLILEDVVDIGNGSYTSCAVDTAGALWCWGQDFATGTGPGPDGIHTRGPAAKQLSSGFMHTCYVAADDSLWCMGRNDHGQLGTGTVDIDSTEYPVDSVEPVLVLAGPISQVVAGFEFTCALDSDGYRWCWGDNEYGQLGDGGTASQFAPWKDTTTTWTTLAAGLRHACGVRADGRVACWGSQQAGADVPLGPAVPTRTLIELSAGHSGACARDSSGEVFCWGANGGAQLGDGSTTDKTFQEALDGGGLTEAGPWVDLAGGASNSCGVKQDGTLWCWPFQPAMAQPIPGQGPWQSVTVSAYGSRVCAVATDGSPWCFGDVNETYYEMGPNHTFDRWDYWDAWLQVDGSGWSQLSAEYSQTCGLRGQDSYQECSAR